MNKFPPFSLESCKGNEDFRFSFGEVINQTVNTPHYETYLRALIENHGTSLYYSNISALRSVSLSFTVEG